MPDQHRQFFEELPFVVAGALDSQGRPWATMFTGAPGFVRSPDDVTLTLHANTDVLGGATEARFEALAPIGLLGIQLETRRRNRANGVVRARTNTHIDVAVKQSFGNCPKYIRPRKLGPTSRRPTAAERFGATLPEAVLSLVNNADTFFLATASRGAERAAGKAPEGVDVSHRGGPAGFVRVGWRDAGHTLSFPDYPGNNLFNSLGNLADNPIAGLLFVDFESGDVAALHVADAVVHWEPPRESVGAAAERWIELTVVEGHWRQGALPFTNPQ
ncbi:MAG: pyridoxamine 5'-phosphate oxidase family protein [Polyangiaceae bacterium]